jgi:hypothetical protein
MPNANAIGYMKCILHWRLASYCACACLVPVSGLDMSWLSLPRLESRAVGVACCCLVWSGSEGRGRYTQYPLGVGQTYVGKAVNGRIVRVCKRR